MVERFVQLAETPGTPPAKPIAQPRIRSARPISNEPWPNWPEQTATHRRLLPGAEYGPAKRWPAAHFAALARQLAEQGCAIWLFGSPKDHAVAEEISQLAPSSVATCAAPPRWPRPSICSPWPTWSSAMTPA
jgi:heptosyltransferase-2